MRLRLSCWPCANLGVSPAEVSAGSPGRGWSVPSGVQCYGNVPQLPLRESVPRDFGGPSTPALGPGVPCQMRCFAYERPSAS